MGMLLVQHSPALASSEETDCSEVLRTPQGQEVLAKLQEALSEIRNVSCSTTDTPGVQPQLQQQQQQQTDHNVESNGNGVQSKHRRSSGSGSSAQGGKEGQPLDPESKLQMSRSIMRKLYYKNVNLEKEIAVLKANQVSGDDRHLLHSTSDLGLRLRPSTASTLQLNPLSQALQERELTILQLQHALDASRRQCSLLQSLNAGTGHSRGQDGSNGNGNGPSHDSVREALEQSALHFGKYKQIRDDYHWLLSKRASTLQTTKAAATQAKHVLGEMQQRLAKEMDEREAEAALYSARLYESERQMSDWYVEKRMMEDHIAKLSEEIRTRDHLDAEIEGCVCSLLARLQHAEMSNQQMRNQLQETASRAAPEMAVVAPEVPLVTQPSCHLRMSKSVSHSERYTPAAADAAMGGSFESSSSVPSSSDSEERTYSPFPRAREKDPYRLLGLGQDASFEEIQDARNYLFEQYKWHEFSRESIELAFDGLIQTKLKERHKLGFKPPRSGKRGEAEGDGVRMTMMRRFQSIFDPTVTWRTIVNEGVIYGVLALWSAFSTDQSFPLAATFAYSVYQFQSRRTKLYPEGPHFGGNPMVGALLTTLLNLALACSLMAVLTTPLAPLLGPSIRQVGAGLVVLVVGLLGIYLK